MQLLDILSKGRRAGAKAAESAGSMITGRVGISHVHAWQRELMLANLALDLRSPQLFPDYAHFDLRADAGMRPQERARMVAGVR